MKVLQLMFLAILGLSLNAQAQKRSDKAVISTPTIQCGMCKSKIEKTLPRMTDGITSVQVNVKAKTTTVTWLTDRTNIEEIKTAIANIGYDAGDVTAEETAYKRLPTCCKKPEDRGEKR
ncbi:MAG TPA: heavy-metal-associated domain-containing protein [Ferruginibacter sp.]|nr:heavy metal transporter [Chitinophagaceae bacterium]HML58300.1 heavy-metal-associated domain-containing protein [Ferruginibacter sp.]HRN91103.1 heavy-metal-associated domain-containing protein [Ferruginibacter sp.]HRO05796.1 heavy-metal-associated domain-containing protein [Ferruginibacter sp.]HRO95910.1 heavy-metal-associated domain-containing protein [Ferruginibacter sp.]